MTPKEKAEELIKKFKPFSYYDGHDLTTRRRREESNIESAIECAIIAIDELIEYSSQIEPYLGVEWFRKVKQELERL